MKNQDKVQIYWNKFKSTAGIEGNDYTAWSFGNTKEMADNLASLVAKGVKTATTSSLDLYEPDEAKPFVDEYNIILDGSENPVCITKPVVVEKIPFNLVSQEHAYHEGEGDRSLHQWRKEHEAFFKSVYKQSGKIFTEDSLCLCEVFEVVFN